MSDQGDNLGKSAEEAAKASFEARRRLLKASAAAPLLMTLAPSSALALSSAAACIGKNADDDTFQNAVSQNPVTTSLDNVVRQEVPYYTVKESALKHLKEGDPVPQNYLLVNGSAYLEDGTPYTEAVSPSNYANAESRYALVYFDGSGTQPTAIWPEGSNGGALSGSCWNSVNPGGGGVSLNW